MERKMDKDFINGLMDLCIRESGKITRSMELEATSGMMGKSTLESGLTVTWRDTEFKYGMTVVDMRVSTSMIRSKVSQYITLQTVRSMRDTGLKVSNTVLE
jgi:hypothetical protein